jgi:hypothetical protein
MSATPQTLQIHAPDALSLASDSIVRADGTLWSHAATLGTRTKEFTFTIDRGCVENIIRVFTSGYPQKVPVDYSHGLVNPDPAVAQARAMGKVPKAGDVKELAGVFSTDDFEKVEGLKAAAEKLAAKASRKLDDSRNFGLWMRWEPTVRALQGIQARELTELSITFTTNCTNPSSGEDQGPAILAVALTNLPFLDDMLPVAASQDVSQPAATTTPSITTQGDTRMTTAKVTLLAATAAMLGKVVSNEDEAVTELTANFQPELTRLREYSQKVGAELGEADPAKAAGEVRKLTAKIAKYEADAKKARADQIDEVIKTVRKKYEDRIVPALFDGTIGPALKLELEAGKKLEDTDAVKGLEAMPAHNITGRIALGDDGRTTLGAGSGQDDRMAARVQQLMQSDEKVKKEWDKNGEFSAYMMACGIAEDELAGATASRR